MKNYAITFAALTLFSSFASAQSADETRCRSASSIYSASWSGQGTATGLYGDYIVICDRWGNIVFCQTVGWCVNHQGGVVAGVVAHSGGQTSVRLNFAALGNLAGGTYEIRRNGVVIDRDAIN